MIYQIPANPQEVSALRQKPVDEELVAAAIAGVIGISRSQGKSLDQLTAELLADDNLLDLEQRRWLKDVVAHVWETLG